MNFDQWSLDPVSLSLGVVLGVLVVLLVWKVRRSTSPGQIRDFNTRLISLNMQLDRTKRELSEMRGVVGRLIDERKRQTRNGDSYDSDVVGELRDSDPFKLTTVIGIGPKLAITLASYGITDLARLASISDQEMAVIESSAPALADRISREGWKQQALRLLESPERESPELESDPENPAEAAPSTGYIDSFDWSRFRQSGSSQPVNGSTTLHS